MLLKYLLVCARNRKFKDPLCYGGSIDLNAVMGKREQVYGLQWYVDTGVC